MRPVLASLLFTLFFCTNGLAQTTPPGVTPTVERRQPSPITRGSGFLGPTFYYDNLIVQSYNFRRAMVDDYEALAVLNGSGFMESGGVLLGTFGVLVGLEVLADESEGRIFDNDGTSLGVGAGMLVAGGILKWLANRKRIKAVGIYNANLAGKPLGRMPDLHLQLGAGNHGLGLLARF